MSLAELAGIVRVVPETWAPANDPPEEESDRVTVVDCGDGEFSVTVNEEEGSPAVPVVGPESSATVADGADTTKDRGEFATDNPLEEIEIPRVPAGPGRI